LDFHQEEETNELNDGVRVTLKERGIANKRKKDEEKKEKKGTKIKLD